MNTNKFHWENVYASKTPQEVSWTQAYPSHSMELIQPLLLEKSDPIIDVGGGDSYLVDALLEEGFTDITVLDIAENALERAQKRLGHKAHRVKWICCDILDFTPLISYALWHDRAAFHFLTQPEAIKTYIDLVGSSVSKNMILGTFSKTGPEKCSGLPITQYNCTLLKTTFKMHFNPLQCMDVVHTTPFKTLQNFIFSSFAKKD